MVTTNRTTFDTARIVKPTMGTHTHTRIKQRSYESAYQFSFLSIQMMFMRWPLKRAINVIKENNHNFINERKHVLRRRRRVHIHCTAGFCFGKSNTRRCQEWMMPSERPLAQNKWIDHRLDEFICFEINFIIFIRILCGTSSFIHLCATMSWTFE